MSSPSGTTSSCRQVLLHILISECILQIGSVYWVVLIHIVQVSKQGYNLFSWWHFLDSIFACKLKTMPTAVDSWQCRLLLLQKGKYTNVTDAPSLPGATSLDKKSGISITVATTVPIAFTLPDAVPHSTWQHLMKVVSTTPLWLDYRYTISLSVITLSVLPSTITDRNLDLAHCTSAIVLVNSWQAKCFL